MFDPMVRRLIDPLLDRAGIWLAGWGIGANQMTLAGLAVGLAAVPALALGHYVIALALILLNRTMDGLDGAIARQGGATGPISGFGGYLDIVCDMAFYAAVPMGFAMADTVVNALPACVLLASFVCTAASFLGRAALAAQHGEADGGTRGRKSFFHSAGLIEGSETVAAFVIFCLFPGDFPGLAWVFAGLCFWTAAARVWVSRQEVQP